MTEIKARQLFCAALPTTWRTATCGGGGASIATSPEGRIGIIRIYEYSKGLWRSKLNNMAVRRRGTHKGVSSNLEPCCEVTCTQIEIPTVARWLAESIVAGHLLESPIPLRDENDPSYMWTAEAARLHRKSR